MNKFVEFAGILLLSFILVKCDLGWFIVDESGLLKFNVIGAIINFLSVLVWTGICKYTRK